MRIVLDGTAEELAGMLKAITSDEVKAEILLKELAKQGILTAKPGSANVKQDEVFAELGLGTLRFADFICTYGQEGVRGKYLDVEDLQKHYSLHEMRSMAGGAKKVCTRLQMPPLFIIVKTKNQHRYIVNGKYNTALIEYYESLKSVSSWKESLLEEKDTSINTTEKT
jgi:hypothetical protein